MNILVSGSNRGLGYQIANELDVDGNDVWRHSRKKLPKSKFESYKIVHAELSDRSECDNLANYFSKKNVLLDGLICNAGSGKSVPMGVETPYDWHKSFNDNFYSAVNLVQALETAVLKPQAKIVIIGSICGSNYIDGAPLTYSCAKGALETFVNNYASHLSRRGIQITYLELGNMFFEGSSWETKLEKNPAAVSKMIKGKVPLEKLGKVPDIMGFIRWFLSQENKFATGSKFTIDGGQTI